MRNTFSSFASFNESCLSLSFDGFSFRFGAGLIGLLGKYMIKNVQQVILYFTNIRKDIVGLSF